MSDESEPVPLSVPPLEPGDELRVTAGGDTFGGQVARVDTYDSSDVERVVEFIMRSKPQINGPDWVPWKGYLVEEPAGEYRANIVLSDGERSTSRTLPALSSIAHKRNE